MSDSLFLALGSLAFLVCCGVHWAVYARLAPGLRVADLERRRAAMVRYFKVLAAWEAAVMVVVVAYAIVERSSHPDGLAWIAPAIGALAGNAFPLQLAALAISRSHR